MFLSWLMKNSTFYLVSFKNATAYHYRPLLFLRSISNFIGWDLIWFADTDIYPYNTKGMHTDLPRFFS